MTATILKHYGPDGKLLDITEASGNQVKLTITGAGEHRFEVEIPENSPIKSVTLTRTASSAASSEALIAETPVPLVMASGATRKFFVQIPDRGVQARVDIPGVPEGAVSMVVYHAPTDTTVLSGWMAEWGEPAHPVETAFIGVISGGALEVTVTAHQAVDSTITANIFG